MRSLEKMFMHGLITHSNARRLSMVTALLISSFSLSSVVANENTDREQESLATPAAEIKTDAAPDTTAEDLARTRNQLEHLESISDAYDYSIGELSLELGALLARQGQTEEALSAYRRALHVSRINYGLDSVLQLPVLEAMLEVQTKANQIESAGNTLHRIYRVHQENYLPDDPATIEVLTRIGVWHFSAYFFEIDQLGLTHLIKARRALGLAHDFSLQSEQGYNFHLYNLLVMTDFGLATMAGSSETSNSDPSGFSGPSQGTTNIINNSYRRGKNLLEKGIEEANESQHPESMVRALLLYADWNQIFNKRNAARKLYLNAYQTARQLPEESPLRKAFNRPHRLPDFNSASLQFGPKDTETRMVSVKFNVDDWGVSKSIEILTNAEDEKIPQHVKRAARNTVRSAAYRPAIANGQLIDSLGVTQIIVVEL